MKARSAAKRILIDHHAAIGDTICAEPALRALKKEVGEDSLIILRVAHPELFRNHPSLSHVDNSFEDFVERDYDRIIKLSVAPTKENRRRHLVDRAAEQIGVSLDDRIPRIYLDEKDAQSLQKFGLPFPPKLKIAISPAVNWSSRLWERSDKWARLCRILINEFDATIIQLGHEGSYTANLGIDLVGRTTVREAAVVLSSCDLLISVDTGLIHLAAAVGTACVGLYGPIYPELRMHPGPGRAVISAEAQCRGCFHWYEGEVENCPKGHHECMRLISVESVVFAVSKMLSSRRGSFGFRGSFLSGSSCH